MIKKRFSTQYRIGIALLVMLLLVEALTVFTVSAQTPRRVNRGLLRNRARVSSGDIVLYPCTFADGTPDTAFEERGQYDPFTVPRRSPGFVLNLRATPSIDGTIISTIFNDELIFILDDGYCHDGLLWRPVIYRGRYGWAAESSRTRQYMVRVEEDDIAAFEENAPERLAAVCSSDEIRPDEIHDYQVSLRRGERVTFSLNASVTTIVTLTSQNGQVLNLGEFAGRSIVDPWAAIPFQVAETGTYTVSIAPKQPLTAGIPYELTMMRFDHRFIETLPLCI